VLGCLLGLAAFVARPAPEARASSLAAATLVNAASYTGQVAPGSLAALFDPNITQPDQSAIALPLPTTLAGVTVKINGITAPLLGVYGSARQINLQVPSGVSPGTATVELFQGSSTTPISTGTVTIAEAAPGIFAIAEPTGQAAALNYNDGVYSINADFDRLPGSRPQASGQYIIIYATGIGATSPLVPDGQAAPASPLAVTTGVTKVTIGGVEAQVGFSGLAPGFVGLWQINALLPSSLPTNLSTSVRVELKGGQSTQATLAVANQNEFTNVTGSVVNALTGVGLAGASLSAQPSGSGRARAVTTDANGLYSFYAFTGNYTLTASASGFLTATQGATISGGQTNALAPIALTPPLATGQYRVVVTWRSGVDLDAHLTGPSGSSLYHVWWNGETDLATPATAQLDRDDLTGAGPETVTFTPQASGTYRFSVQNYTHRDIDGHTGLAQSGAIVHVYSGAQHWVFTVPSGGGTLWKVFKIENGVLSAINQLADEPVPSNIKNTVF
jgi:uncharacterized protein (TIGR03437 family)